MKTILILIAGLLIGTGCVKYPKKPYIIIRRSNIYDNEVCYTYIGSNGITDNFYDKPDKYSVGDTIK